MSSILDRIILICVSLLLLVVGLTAVGAPLLWDLPTAATRIGQYLAVHPWQTSLGGLLLALTGLHILFHTTASKKREIGIVRDTPLGQVRMNIRAIENLVVQTATAVRGVRNAEATIRPHDEGMEIDVSLVVLPDMSLPEISNEVQKRVEAYVRETVGVSVASIAVEVRNVAGAPKARVD